MRVLALNGSPRMKASSTYHILQPFLAGMAAAGAKTELIHIRRLDLNPCIGCYTCWVRTPGICIYKDSMAEIIGAYNRSDLVIFGTPLYHFSMSGIMKTFIDRLLPRYEPWLIPHSKAPGMTGHPERWPGPKRMFLISPCGFPEFENFDSLVQTFKQLARMEGMTYIGEILRPGAEPLSRPSLQHLFTAYYQLVYQAGKQLATEGRISDELQTELRHDLFPGGKKVFYQMAEGYWNQQMDHFKVPEPRRHTVPLLAEDLDFVPLAPFEAKADSRWKQIREGDYTSNETMMQVMAETYQAQAIPDLQITIQIHFIPRQKDFDSGPADWYLSIAQGNCQFHRGRTPIPTLSIDTPQEVWRGIVAGDLDAVEAFTEGRYEVSGSLQLLRELPRLFNYPRGDNDRSAITAQPQMAVKGKDVGTASLSFRDTVAGMAMVFDAKAAENIVADIQFHATGKEPGDYYLRVADGQCTFHEGLTESPKLTLQTPSEVWLAISRGELDGAQAFMQGKYRVEGDFGLLMRLNQIFRRQ